MVEAVRTLGRTLEDNLPNLDAALRSRIDIGTGTSFRKAFPGHGLCDGVVTGRASVQSSLNPGMTVRAYTVQYPIDGSSEDLEDAELRSLITITDHPERAVALDGVRPAFEYLESRLTEAGPYYYGGIYSMLRAARMFCPVRVIELGLTNDAVDIVAAEIPAIGKGLSVATMKTEFATYIAAANAIEADTWDMNDMEMYTRNVLRFWRRTAREIPELAKAARLAFSISASSAPSERVFSLMKRFFGKYSGRDSSLSDSVSASLVLSYNRRVTP